MAKEIERKFLVENDEYKNEAVTKRLIRQGFLSSKKEAVVRIRVTDQNAFITVKGPSTGSTRAEFEYIIPQDDALEMLEHLCEKPLIEKYRYIIKYEGSTWEVDEFMGENEGLVLAEIELTGENQDFTRPGWLGKEVTADQRYYNSNLIKNPWKDWK